MATTSPDNIYSADINTPADIVAITGAIASSVQTALDNRAGPYSGTSTERDNYTNTAAEGTIWVDTNGEKGVYRKNGASWEKLFPITIPPNPVKAAASGAYTFQRASSGSKSMTETITFPANTFTQPPKISLAVASAVPEIVSVGFSFVTTNDFNLHLWRDTATNTIVHWTALQLD